MRPRALVDGLRLGFGTLTLLPVKAPGSVDRTAAAVAMTLAVLPGAVVGLLAGAVAAALLLLGLAAGVVGVVAVGVAVLLTRFLHVDGLADTADGLVAGHTPERALEVMHRGDVGPAGATSLLLVLGGQAAAVGALVEDRPWWAVVGLLTLAWAASRAVLALLTAVGTRPAQAGGLGAGVLGSVPRALCWVPAGVLALLGLVLAGPVAALAVLAAVVAAGALASHAHRRLGGLTGDVLGAGVEVALLAALAVLTAL
ncbi:adenosylcobinamide-GDP ribazoletransferase [Aquipuribacter sp. MA13-6]|uniref:adenosylcobinamide-GDP ribazoletransferase n=1 Tax=unclassified Aquipuribacter TaxID=2635084 RepID=UPI003EF0690A